MATQRHTPSHLNTRSVAKLQSLPELLIQKIRGLRQQHPGKTTKGIVIQYY
jgi:hypothetical protein